MKRSEFETRSFPVTPVRPTHPSEQLDHFFGLPNQEEIEDKLDDLYGPWQLFYQPVSDTEQWNLTIRLNLDRELPLLWTAEQQQRFLLEREADIQTFRLRLQRLKMSLLELYLGSSIPSLLSSAQMTDRQKTTDDRFGVQKNKLLERGDFAIPESRAAYIRHFNQYIPEEFRLHVSKGLNAHDSERFFELALAMLYRPAPKGHQKRQLEAMLLEVADLERDLDVKQQQGELFVHDQGVAVGERALADRWKRYRFLLKEMATMAEQGNWYSPTYGSSDQGQRGPSQRSERMRTDYQRFRMNEMDEAERAFQKYYFGEREYRDYAESLLVSNGMSALGIILQYTSQGVRRKNAKSLKIFKQPHIYGEVDNAINQYYQTFPAEITDTDTKNVTRLAERIKTELPHVVFLSPVNNGYELDFTDIYALLRQLTHEKWQGHRIEREYRERNRTILLVIDNTFAGRLAGWKQFPFGELPSFIKIACFESLVKYGQDGQELTQAALLTTFGEYIASDLRGVRDHAGQMPPEATAHRLQAVLSVDVIDKNLERQSRNLKQIAAILREDIEATPDGILSEFVLPGGPAQDPDKIPAPILVDTGCLGNLGLDWEFLETYQEKHVYSSTVHLDKPIAPFKQAEAMREVADAFIKLTMQFAKTLGVELNQGTSYGFHTTRLSRYDRNVSDTPETEYKIRPYLRLAVGTENLKDNRLIAEILRRVNHVFAEARKKGNVLSLVRSQGEFLTKLKAVPIK